MLARITDPVALVTGRTNNVPWEPSKIAAEIGKNYSSFLPLIQAGLKVRLTPHTPAGWYPGHKMGGSQAFTLTKGQQTAYIEGCGAAPQGFSWGVYAGAMGHSPFILDTAPSGPNFEPHYHYPRDIAPFLATIEWWRDNCGITEWWLDHAGPSAIKEDAEALAYECIYQLGVRCGVEWSPVYPNNPLPTIFNDRYFQGFAGPDMDQWPQAPAGCESVVYARFEWPHTDPQTIAKFKRLLSLGWVPGGDYRYAAMLLAAYTT